MTGQAEKARAKLLSVIDAHCSHTGAPLPEPQEPCPACSTITTEVLDQFDTIARLLGYQPPALLGIPSASREGEEAVVSWLQERVDSIVRPESALVRVESEIYPWWHTVPEGVPYTDHADEDVENGYWINRDGERRCVNADGTEVASTLSDVTMVKLGPFMRVAPRCG